LAAAGREKEPWDWRSALTPIAKYFIFLQIMIISNFGKGGQIITNSSEYF
jgi:hypothetical protein